MHSTAALGKCFPLLYIPPKTLTRLAVGLGHGEVALPHRIHPK